MCIILKLNKRNNIITIKKNNNNKNPAKKKGKDFSKNITNFIARELSPRLVE